jgi:hypothetical protein
MQRLRRPVELVHAGQPDLGHGDPRQGTHGRGF